MRGVYVLLVALAAVSTAPDMLRAGQERLYEAQLKALLEGVFQNSSLPNEQLGLPALDPFVLEHLALDMDNSLARLTGSLDGLNATGLRKTRVVSAGVNIVGFKISVALSLASFALTGNYSVDGDLGGDALHLFGEGPFSVLLSGIELSTTIALKTKPHEDDPDGEKYLYVNDMTLSVTLKESEIDLQGLFGGGELGTVICQVLSEWLPQAVGEIVTLVTPTLKQFIDTKLYDVTMNDILGLLS